MRCVAFVFIIPHEKKNIIQTMCNFQFNIFCISKRSLLLSYFGRLVPKTVGVLKMVESQSFLWLIGSEIQILVLTGFTNSNDELTIHYENTPIQIH